MHSVEIPEATTVPTTNGEAPLPRRNGYRGMLPGSWMGRELRLEYAGAGGRAVSTNGVLLDWFAVGPILNVGGARTCFSWDRIVVIELVGG